MVGVITKIKMARDWFGRICVVHFCLSWVFAEPVRQSSTCFAYVDFKQLLDEVFVISGIIKVEVSVISRSRRLRLITQKPNLIIVLFYIVLKKITTNALSQRSQFIFKHLKMYNETRSHSYFAVCELDIAVRALDIALGNHALRAQPTDYSLILGLCRLFINPRSLSRLNEIWFRGHCDEF